MSVPEDSLDVLVIEDDPNDVRLIRRHLTRAEGKLLPDRITVRHEGTLEEGIGAIDDDTDLLLLDLGLRKTSGEETFRRISDRTAGIPIIVLTNLEDQETAVSLLQQGAQDYLTKASLSEEGLVRAVRYALERENRQAELQVKREQLEILNRLLSHDISNDVMILQGWTQQLLDRVDDEEDRAKLEGMLEAIGHIDELTENSREFVRAITERSELDLHPIRLDELLNDELEKALSRYPSATFEVDRPLPAVTVEANQMLSSVFRNLLNNAVQHNDKPHPRVEVAIEDGGPTVRVSIADNGPGMSERLRRQAFGQERLRLEHGTDGLGLYLVTTIVSRFGGTVRAESGDEEGAVVVVELERVEPAA